MLKKNLPFRHALWLCQEYIIFSYFFQNLISDHVGVIPQVFQRHNRKRHNKMPDPISHILRLSRGICTAAWQDSKGYSKNQNQYNGQPEFRNTAWYGSYFAQNPVTPSVFLPRTENSQQKGTCKNEKKSNPAQQKSIYNSSADYLQNILFVFKGNTKITMKRLPKPFYILYMDWFIKSQLL